MRTKEEKIIRDPWSFEYDKTLNLAIRNKRYRKTLLDALFIRTMTFRTAEEFKTKLSKKNIYESYVNDVIKNGNDFYKIHLVLYFEPQLLSYLFKNMDNLVRKIIANLEMEEYIGYKEDCLTEISQFVTDDDLIYEIKSEIMRLLEKRKLRMLDFATTHKEIIDECFGMDDENTRTIFENNFQMGIQYYYSKIDSYQKENCKNNIKLKKRIDLNKE